MPTGCFDWLWPPRSWMSRPPCSGLLFAAAVGCTACGRAPTPSQRAAAAPPGSRSESSSEPSAAGPSRTAPPDVAQAPRPEPAVELRPIRTGFELKELAVIKRPTPGQRLALTTAHRFSIRLDHPKLSEGQRLMLKLDDRGPRALNAAQHRLPLGELLFELDQLEPGSHRLVAFVEGETPSQDAVPLELQVVVFEIAEDDAQAAPEEASREPASQAPSNRLGQLVYLHPSGTFNGPQAAQRVELAFAVLGRDQAASVRITEPNGAVTETRLEAGRYAVQHLSSGDYHFELSLGAPNPQGLWTSERHTITVNRDVEVQ